MGLDFGIRLMKKDVNEITLVDTNSLPKSLPIINMKDLLLSPLFKDNIGKVKILAGQDLYLDFYEKADSTWCGDPKNKDVVCDPKKTKETLQIILRVLKENPGKFPFSYVVEHNGDSKYTTNSGSVCVGEIYVEKEYVGIKKVYICGGWNRCYYEVNGKRVDVTKEPIEKLNEIYFQGHSIKTKIIGGKMVETKGDPLILSIKKISMYDDFYFRINAIIELCDYAIKNNYYIQGWFGC